MRLPPGIALRSATGDLDFSCGFVLRSGQCFKPGRQLRMTPLPGKLRLESCPIRFDGGICPMGYEQFCQVPAVRRCRGKDGRKTTGLYGIRLGAVIEQQPYRLRIFSQRNRRMERLVFLRIAAQCIHARAAGQQPGNGSRRSKGRRKMERRPPIAGKGVGGFRCGFEGSPAARPRLQWPPPQRRSRATPSAASLARRRSRAGSWPQYTAQSNAETPSRLRELASSGVVAICLRNLYRNSAPDQFEEFSVHGSSKPCLIVDAAHCMARQRRRGRFVCRLRQPRNRGPLGVNPELHHQVQQHRHRLAVLDGRLEVRFANGVHGVLVQPEADGPAPRRSPPACRRSPITA